jgi:hypothetical protein
MMRQSGKAKDATQKDLAELPALLSVSQAAKALGLTRQGLWNAIYKGYVETVKSGPYTLVPRHAVERYAAQERKPGPKPQKGR